MAASVLFYDAGPFSVGAVKFDLLLEEHHELKSTITQHPVEDGKGPVSDHVVRELRTGSLKGFVSNFSLNTAAELPDEIRSLIGNNARRYTGLASAVATGLMGGVLANQNDALQKVGSVGIGVGNTAGSFAGRYPSEAAIRTALGNLQRPPNRARDAFGLFESLWTAGEPVTIVTGLKKYDNVMVTLVSVSRTSETGEALEFDVSFSEFRRVKTKKTIVEAAIAPKLTTDAGKQASPQVSVGRTTGTGKTSNAAKAALKTKVSK